MFHFYALWKHLENGCFVIFSGGIRMKHCLKMGWSVVDKLSDSRFHNWMYLLTSPSCNIKTQVNVFANLKVIQINLYWMQKVLRPALKIKISIYLMFLEVFHVDLFIKKRCFDHVFALQISKPVSIWREKVSGGFTSLRRIIRNRIFCCC